MFNNSDWTKQDQSIVLAGLLMCKQNKANILINIRKYQLIKYYRH